MKLAIAIFVSALGFLSCKKEKENVPLRCGTTFSQPLWAKNFSQDSLSNISAFVFVSYRSQLPLSQSIDTSYDLSVPVQFYQNGTGILNNNTSFIYSIVRTGNFPEVHITGLSDISSLFPFSTNFLNQPVIKFRTESLLKTGGQFAFTNGVQYPLTTQKYESCFLSFKRN